MSRLIKFSFVFLAASSAFAQAPGYGGPAILSRGQIAGAQQKSALFNIRPFVSLSGLYDDGLVGTVVDSQGHVVDTASYGIEGRAGVTGYHSWKRSTLGLDYSIDGRHYTQHSSYDGIDQSLALNYDRKLTRRLEWNVQEAAGIFSRSFGLIGGGEFIDPNLVNIPTNEIFDSRVYYQSTFSTVTYQKTLRWSFSAGGSEFLAQRHSPILISGHGYGAYGDAAYRLNKTSTVSAFYSFGHFAYARSFGAADFHVVGLSYTKNFGRYWQVSIAGGVDRIEVLGLTLVPIDPVIAAIIGQSTGVQVAYHLNYLPQVQANLTRNLRRSSFTLSYNEGINPGNGIYLASRSRSGSGNYTYSGFRKWSVGAHMDYTRFSDLTRAIGAYESYGGGVSGNYRIVRSLFFSIDGSVRAYSAGSTFSQRGYSATAGFSWSPGEYPISFR